MEFSEKAGQVIEIKVGSNKTETNRTTPLSQYLVDRANELRPQRDDVAGILKHISDIGELNKSIYSLLNEVSIGEPLVVAGAPSVTSLQVRLRERIDKFTSFLGVGDNKNDGWNVVVDDARKSVDNYCDFSVLLERKMKEKVDHNIMQVMLASPIVREELVEVPSTLRVKA